MDFTFLLRDDLNTLAVAFKTGKLGVPVTTFALQRYLQKELAQRTAEEIGRLQTAGFNTEQMGLLFESLASQSSGGTSVEIELVATGPDVPGVSLRDTSVVVRELFAKARKEVLVVGYAVYQGRHVFAALAENMDRNPDLKVTFCLDVKRGPDGDPDAGVVLSQFKERFKTREWPGKRLPDLYYDPRSLSESKGVKSALHAKCIVVDRSECFISSANFTEAAQERNIEVGVYIKVSTTANSLCEYFKGLIEKKLLNHI